MMNWHDADGKIIKNRELVLSLSEYSKAGGLIYIGTDSMLYSKNCNFASVIALHSSELNVAKYYFKKKKVDANLYKNLNFKIMNEVSLSLETAQLVLDMCPNAKIEIHVDIGKTKKSKTRLMFPEIKGWVTGAGFDLKVKPRSWSSDIADWHTK